MNLLIYGSRGWIGSQFKEILQNQNINYTEGSSRVDDEDKLLEEIVNINPTHIISFIGRTHGKILDKEYSTIDYLEEKGKILTSDRSNNYLDTTRLESLFPEVLNIKDSVRNILYEYKNSILG